MGSFASTPLPRAAVAGDKTRICISGFAISHHTGRAAKIARTIQSSHPSDYETWFYFDTFGFRPKFLNSIKAELSPEQQKEFESHNTSPFCWLEKPDGSRFAIGGRDKLCDWVEKNFQAGEDDSILDLCKGEPTKKEIFFDNSSNGSVQKK